MNKARHPLLVTMSVMLASFLYSLDWTIVAVALPHMQGTFSATQDQISWVITSYIVAAAISLPTAGWLAARFGRKRMFLWATTIFLIASIVCGMANSLELEIAARIVQGLGGAFLIPISQFLIEFRNSDNKHFVFRCHIFYIAKKTRSHRCCYSLPSKTMYLSHS